MVCVSTLLSWGACTCLTGLGAGAMGWRDTICRTKEPLALTSQYQRNRVCGGLWYGRDGLGFGVVNVFSSALFLLLRHNGGVDGRYYGS